MAYVGPEKKAKIQAALKTAIPRDWKWSLRVRHHSTAALTIYSAPVDLIEVYTRKRCAEDIRAAVMRERHLDVNVYYWREHFDEESGLFETFQKIFAALNIDNFDNSDPSTDYFHVGHYVDVQFGRFDRPFVCPQAAVAA